MDIAKRLQAVIDGSVQDTCQVREILATGKQESDRFLEESNGFSMLVFRAERAFITGCATSDDSVSTRHASEADPVAQNI